MNEISQAASVLVRRWFVILAVTLIGLSLLPFVANGIPAFTAHAQLLVVSEAQKDTTSADPNLPAIITSTEVMSRVIDRLKLKTDATRLAKQIKTKLPAKASIVDLTYKDTDAERSAAVANAIVDETVVYYHQIATGGYTDVLKALGARIADSRARIAAADRRLQQASAKNAFASSDAALNDLTSQIDQLQVQRGQINASLAADRATAAALQAELRNINPIVRGEVLQRDVVYQQLLARLAKDSGDLVSERSSFRDSFPGLVAFERRVNRERAQLKSYETLAVRHGAGLSPSFTQTTLDGEHAAGGVAADLERLRATDMQLRDEEKHLREVAGAGALVGTLRAERDAALQQYTVLNGRLATAQGDAALAASLGNLVVVGRAVPGRSGLWTYLLALVIVIFVAAVCAAYFVDAIDRRFWGNREIEKVYRRPVLTEVGAH